MSVYIHYYQQTMSMLATMKVHLIIKNFIVTTTIQ